ncbi:MAG: methionyl-tRNA formyltransferase [Cycloclasticus sp.]|nr:MAG: methionyl-tRNA formyltransferase [Cycloclasticus sp.]
MNIIFAGTPEFSVPALTSLIGSKHKVCAVYTQPDRPAGRGRKVQVSPVKQCALEAGIPIEQPLDFKTADSLNTLTSYEPDLMVVVAYGIILPVKVLDLPTHGCINIHASVLPRWRGAAPIQRAILSGDKETGITLMQMDKGLDTGDILSKVTVTIGSNDTSSTLHDKLSNLGADALMALLNDVEDDQLNPTQQLEADATYAHKLDKQEALLNWNKPSIEIQRTIQGYNPWPVAHTVLNGKSLRIWQAKLSTDRSDASPGHVKASKNQLFVACADKYLEIIELQPANKRRMSTREYLAAHQINGSLLG